MISDDVLLVKYNNAQTIVEVMKSSVIFLLNTIELPFNDATKHLGDIEQVLHIRYNMFGNVIISARVREDNHNTIRNFNITMFNNYKEIRIIIERWYSLSILINEIIKEINDKYKGTRVFESSYGYRTISSIIFTNYYVYFYSDECRLRPENCELA